MIKAILFTVGFLVLAAVAGIAIWQGIKYSKRSEEESRYEDGLAELEKKHKESIDYIKFQYSGKTADAELARENKKYDTLVEQYKAEHQVTEAKPLGFLTAVGLTLAALAFVITVPGSFHQVETGTVAVVRQLGKINDLRLPGTYFDFYMTNKYETYDTKVQQDKITTFAYSKDGQTMELEVFLQYQVQSENIMKIATEYGSLDALQARIETVTIEKTKAIMSSAEAMTIIQNRAQFSNNVSDNVRNGISADYYVNVKDVVLTNIDFTDEFEKAVEDKVIAEQQKQASITKAEAELEVAKLEAKKKIEEAHGNAEAQKIVAQASAEAATYNIIELARTIGYTVNEEYTYKTEVKTEYSNGDVTIATAEDVFDVKQEESTTTETVGIDTGTMTVTTTVTLVATKYDIDITTGPGADKFKSLVEDYLQYLAYLAKWDGNLPDVVAGDDALSIIVPGGN